MKSAVCLLIIHNGLVLAVSRKNDFTRWGLPGGKVDPFESNVEACQREVLEEIGLLAAQTSYEPIYSGICPGKGPDDTYWVTTYLWVDHPISDEELRAEEGLGIKWMEVKDLVNPNKTPFSAYNVKVFEAYEQYMSV